MATYSAQVGAWATRPYGGDEEAWKEAKRQCRAALYEWAAAGHAGTYTEVTHRVTAIQWPDGAHTSDGQQIGYLLGQVSHEELVRTESRPVLSALVVGRAEGMPTAGSWTAWSSDGRWISFFARTASGDLSINLIHPDGSGAHRLATTTPDASNVEMIWSGLRPRWRCSA